MKRFILVFLVFAFIIFFQSCSKKQEQVKQKTAMEQTTQKAEFTADMLDIKMCGCGMDFTKEGAHIADTVHYHGKVLGFCSEQCKQAFEKDPEGYLAKLTSEVKEENHEMEQEEKHEMEEKE